MAETRIRRDLYAEVGGELPVIKRIESRTQVEARAETCANIPSGYYLFTFDQAVWHIPGRLASRAGLIVERAFTARRRENVASFIASLRRPNLPDPEPNQLWLRDMNEHMQYSSRSSLNDRIQSSPRPQLVTEHVIGRSGLIAARRSVGIGPLLEKSLWELKRFEDIRVLPAGAEALGRDEIFGERTLVDANVDIFNASPVDAEADLRTLLELETYPVNNSLHDPSRLQTSK